MSAGVSVAGNRFLGALFEAAHRGPIRICLDKSGDARKIGVGSGAGQIHPFDQLFKDWVAASIGDVMRLAPAVGIGRGNSLPGGACRFGHMQMNMRQVRRISRTCKNDTGEKKKLLFHRLMTDHKTGDKVRVYEEKDMVMFTGSITALITPFKDGKIDEGCLSVSL